MLFYKMRSLNVGAPSCPNLYLESSYPRCDLMPWPAVGKALLPRHTVVIIPGQYWAPPQTYRGLPASPHTTPDATEVGTATVVACAFARKSVQEGPGSRRFAIVWGVPRAVPRAFIAQASHGTRGVVRTLVNNPSMLPEPGDLFPS